MRGVDRAGQLHASELAGHDRLSALEQKLAEHVVIGLVREVTADQGRGVRVEQAHLASRSCSSASLTDRPAPRWRSITASRDEASAGLGGDTRSPECSMRRSADAVWSSTAAA